VAAFSCVAVDAQFMADSALVVELFA